MSEDSRVSAEAPASGIAPANPAVGAIPLALTLGGIAVLVAAAFVRVPTALGIAAIASAVAGAVWIAVALRRWQAALAAVWMVASLARDLAQHRPIPPGGTGVLVTLVAFAVLVLGGAWLGNRNARG